MTIVSPDRVWLTRAAVRGRGGDIAERDRVKAALGIDLLASWDWVAERRVTREFWRRAAEASPVPELSLAMERLAAGAVRDSRPEAQGGLAAGRVPPLMAVAEEAVPEWLCTLFSLREADLAVCAAVCVLRDDVSGRGLRKVKHDMVRPLLLLGDRADRLGIDHGLADLFPVGEQWWL